MQPRPSTMQQEHRRVGPDDPSTDLHGAVAKRPAQLRSRLSEVSTEGSTWDASQTSCSVPSRQRSPQVPSEMPLNAEASRPAGSESGDSSCSVSVDATTAVSIARGRPSSCRVTQRRRGPAAGSSPIPRPQPPLEPLEHIRHLRAVLPGAEKSRIDPPPGLTEHLSAFRHHRREYVTSRSWRCTQAPPKPRQ